MRRPETALQRMPDPSGLPLPRHHRRTPGGDDEVDATAEGGDEDEGGRGGESGEDSEDTEGVIEGERPGLHEDEEDLDRKGIADRKDIETREAIIGRKDIEEGYESRKAHEEGVGLVLTAVLVDLPLLVRAHSLRVAAHVTRLHTRDSGAADPGTILVVAHVGPFLERRLDQ